MYRILVVDDTKTVHNYVKSLLTRSNDIELLQAFNGKEAVEFFERGEKADLVLLDWEMPVMTGPETFKLLKEKNILIPVLMMTTKNSIEDITYMLEMGVSEYIIKPFTVDIIFDKINAVTGWTLNYEYK